MNTKRRLTALRQMLDRHQADGILITSPYNRKYMSGFTGSAGILVITRDHAVLITDFRYRTQAPKQAVDFEVMEHGMRMMDSLKDCLARLQIRTLAFEQDHMTYLTYTEYSEQLNGIILMPVSGWLEKLRMVKDDGELRILREACAIADQTYEHMLGVLAVGMTEKHAALELEFYMRGLGADAVSFETIVASGPRSAMPHGVASDRMMQEGDFVTMDFGAYYQGYCSDITRTVALGKATEKHREIYEIVLEAQMHAIQHIRPGMTGKEADALTRDRINRYGYGDCFGHGTGHGIGLEIHESPRLSLSGDTVLEPGMVVTVEPGIYLPDFGGVRIEDDIVITEQGCERLTLADKTWTCIG